MFERFAEEARRATALASEEARQLGHDFIGTEHLLLGLLAAGEGMAFTVLEELEVTLEDARRKVTERVHAYGRASEDSPHFSPLAKKALEKALREALQLKSELIGSEHLLLGLVAVPDGGGARILGELAGSLEQVRRAVLARVGDHLPGAPREQTRAPVTPKTLRRWAVQGLTVLRPPTSAPEATTALGSADPGGPPPVCPSCQASLATEARYRRITVPPAPAEPDQPDEPATAATPTDATTDPATDPATEAAAGDPVVVTAVYCRRCGCLLGIT